ncbi:MAG: RpoL/Rpb11 RNA polymerase subunit family protein [Candidatus Micrarchaeia archaeon]
MPISIIEDTPKSLVIEFQGIDRGVAEAIADKLQNAEGIDFAGVEKEHPEIGNPRLVVKASKNPKALVSKAIDELLEEVEQLKVQMPKK